MRRLLLGLLLCTLSLSSASAELTLQINGPREPVEAGQVVILDRTGTTGTSDWIFPENLRGKVFKGCGDQVPLFNLTPGRYTVYLYGTDGVMLHHVAFTFEVEGPTGPVDPPPLPPPAPGDFSSLEEVSRSQSRALDDPTTRERLAEALAGLSVMGDLSDAQQQTEDAVTKVFAMRTGSSEDVDWTDGWYLPILREFQEVARSGKIRGVDDYQRALASVSRGLVD